MVTQDIADLSQIDSRDLARIPDDVEVLRIQDPDLFATRARRMGHLPPDAALVSGDAISRVDGGTEGCRKRTPFNPSRLVLSAASGVLKWGLRNFVYQPDALRLWASEIVRNTARLDCGDKHVVLTSSPAFSCHMAGLGIKKKLGLPWVADFRDLWVGRPFRSLPTALHEWWDRHLEASVVHGCDRLILASPAWERGFRQRYGDDVARKIVIITNGYEDHLPPQTVGRINGATEPGNETIRFVLTGSMHAGESPIPFIRALGSLKRNCPSLVCSVTADFVGNGGDHLNVIQEEIRNSGVEEQCNLLGARSNEECIRMQREAACLLLFSASEHAETISGKSFEYMATGKPILACIPQNGIQADILRNAGTAMIVEHGDVQATSEALKGFLEGVNEELKPNWEYIQSFNRKNLTGKLAEVLDGVLCARDID